MSDAVGLWVRSELRHGWRSLILVGVLFAVTIGVVLGLVAGARRAGSAVDRFAVASALPDITMFVGEEPPAALLQRLATDERIASVARGTVALAAGGVDPGPNAQTLIGSSEGSIGGFGRPLLVDGRYPMPGARDEVVVNTLGADVGGIAAGDRISMVARPCFELDCELIPLGEVTVVGVVRLSLDLVDDAAVNTIFGAGPGLLNGAWRQAAVPGTILFLHVTNGVGGARLDALVDELSTELGGPGDVSATRADIDTADRTADLQARALWIAAGVAALAGAAATALVTSRHLQRRTSDAAVLAAIGLDRTHRTFAASLSMVPAVVIGVAAGLGIAIATSPLFPLGLTRLAEPDPGVRVDVAALALGALGAAVFVAALTTLSAARWARTFAPAPSSTRTWLVAAGAGLRLRPQVSTGASFALDPGNGAARLPVLPTLAAVTAAVAVTIGAVVVHDNLTRLLDTPTRFGQPWALNVGIDPTDEPSVRALADDPRVASVDLVSYGEVDVAVPGRAVTQVTAIGLDGVDGPSNLVMLDGRGPAAGDEVAMAGETMGALGIALGNRVELSGPCGRRTVEVVGRGILPTFGLGDPGRGLMLSLEGFSTLCADQLSAEIDRISGAALVLHDDADAAAVQTELEADGVFVDRRVVPIDVGALRGLRPVPAMIAAAVAVFGLVAVGHALVLAVRRRRRDLAVLRAIGLSPAGTRSIVRWQALTIAMVSIVIGLPLGIILGRTLWVTIATPINVLSDVDVPVGALAAVAVVVLSAALVVSAVPGQRASRLRPAQVLHTE